MRKEINNVQLVIKKKINSMEIIWRCPPQNEQGDFIETEWFQDKQAQKNADNKCCGWKNIYELMPAIKPILYTWGLAFDELYNLNRRMNIQMINVLARSGEER